MLRLLQLSIFDFLKFQLAPSPASLDRWEMRPRNVKWSTASDPATQNTIWVSIKRNSHSFHWLLDFYIINVLIGGAVRARGCSTLQPNFNKCDTNKYGQFKSDKYCYCKKSYCNTASSCLPNLYCLGRTTTLWFKWLTWQFPAAGVLYSMYLLLSSVLTPVRVSGALRWQELVTIIVKLNPLLIWTSDWLCRAQLMLCCFGLYG